MTNEQIKNITVGELLGLEVKVLNWTTNGWDNAEVISVGLVGGNYMLRVKLAHITKWVEWDEVEVEEK